jgi:RNA polymerase sigma-70 factor, ECF subfamily
MKFSDEELMVMFSAGTKEAFDMLYERHRHPIYRFARACLANGADAEDIVQDVFIRVMKAAPRYQPSGCFKAWLFRIAINRIRSFAVLRNFRAEETLNGTPEPELSSSSDPSSSTEAADLILKSFLQLDAIPRQILFLKEVEGFDTKRIAQMLGLGHDHTRVLIHRARKQILEWSRSMEKGRRS